ncbi:MAG: 16S rRNA (cytidine(1402)-2'-O)-methyltransferase [Stygiobacter sp. RIFOXYC12_FULL_38_8]|nr:MAG: 16S rRNA (cytidine(1402)-2'-O)-methyltransferase [Stygiobacter sp. GWC2_38_9]OGU81991.1 MAG: 16S rRNA (cytidine(1402)-2'-O)-methyltransferase [Stygiobacter sp. RIFOXYA12_FULL_38_9]OGV07134.1 MAG: 16S rRNA (cytidine(1402)-2'-O)-methyltransferase [Stygiobacter sp. RIFOXYB2_FULL_37_11]OGV12349.1 MAG: 16S rRNA (cytidine(1402)-2'-O)-methyltransferase [Stygiobacter sp. RIFOXYC2_FULL_38_25]OGV18031.1 MAG: 16S rRNA (cytidine(1402)-2'-O)-methyltransferase [Stygiobacter sp. RIFOXYA2_FULL_38_8]OG
MKSILHIVSTPIGNYEDITLRALNTLKDVDFIICEEFKEARRFLSHYKIEKELISLNEHNEEEASREVLKKIKEGKSAALISDCGTPLFSDPGTQLVQMCIDAKIEVVPVPGASSIMSALVGSGFKLDKFYYAGWLSPKSEVRKKELLRLKNIKEIIVLMETPYRLKAILADVSKIFGEKVNIVVAFDLTLPKEQFLRGTAAVILKTAEEKNLKGEFVLLIKNN